MEIFDAIVIGSGINGSWAAYQLLKQGQKVLMLEQVNERLKISSKICIDFKTVISFQLPNCSFQLVTPVEAPMDTRGVSGKLIQKSTTQK